MEVLGFRLERDLKSLIIRGMMTYPFPIKKSKIRTFYRKNEKIISERKWDAYVVEHQKYWTENFGLTDHYPFRMNPKPILYNKLNVKALDFGALYNLFAEDGVTEISNGNCYGIALPEHNWEVWKKKLALQGIKRKLSQAVENDFRCGKLGSDIRLVTEDLLRKYNG